MIMGRNMDSSKWEIRKCKMCSNEFKVYKIQKKTMCSSDCRKKWNLLPKNIEHKRKKSIESQMEKYGKLFYQTEEFQQKTKKIKLEKYGDENYVNVEKGKKTKLEKYGDENYNNRDKFKDTMIEIFGGIGLQRPDVLGAAKRGMVEKYGVEYAFQSDDIKNKIKRTNIGKFGKETYWGSNVYNQEMYNKKMESLIPILEEMNLIMLSDYGGSKKIVDGHAKHIKYDFKCLTCDMTFNYTTANGIVPKCPKCYGTDGGTSFMEREFQKYIRELLPNIEIYENDRTLLNGKELDVYIPTKNLAFEFDGLYWHSETKKDKNYHLNKTEKCEKNGVRLIHIFEDEWVYKNDIVKNRIKHIVGIMDKKIYARNTKIKEISAKEKGKFLNQFHVQGSGKSSIKLGAFHNDELVAVMTFGNNRIALGNKNKEGEYELIRFASKYSITGGASKLLSYFTKNYNPSKIISYSDRRWNTGLVYERMGFKKISNGTPGYWYVKNGQRFHRYNFRKSLLSEKLKKFNDSLTEWENMQLNGFDRIWDCGNFKYEMNLK